MGNATIFARELGGVLIMVNLIYFWLYALPIAACGLRLDDEAIRVAVWLASGQ